MKWAVEGIIFDFDGVLVDTARDISNATNYVLRNLGLKELPTETVVGYIGGGIEPLLRRSLGNRADELFEKALPMYKKRYNEHCCEETVTYPRVIEVLDYCRATQKKMGIATNKAEVMTQQIVRGLQLEQYFQVVVGPDSVTHRKPHPEALNLIMERLDVQPSRTVMVGDSTSDILAGKAAGTITCGVTYGYGKPEDIRGAQPDFIIDHPEEFMSYIH